MPTEETPSVEPEVWNGDLFNRKKYSDFLTTLLAGKNEPFVLNINAEWGTGKTFFLTNWKKDIEGTYPTVYFNAWKKDFVEDPLPALISEINNRLSQLSPDGERAKSSYTEKGYKILKAAAPLLVKAVTKRYIGQDGIDDLITATEEDEDSISEIAKQVTSTILEPFEKEEASIAQFKDTLGDILQYLEEETDFKLPMFIFIDELDRCRPLFAIDTLEKVKHLFDIPEITFVIATDTEQLSHSVKAIYGEGFSGRTYLRRFFSQEFSLPSPNNLNFAINLFSSFNYDCKLLEYNIQTDSQRRGEQYNIVKKGDNLNGIEHIESAIIFTLYSNLFNLDLRTQQQCYNRLSAISATTPEHETIHLPYLIFLIMLKENDPKTYNKYFSNHSSTDDIYSIESDIPNSKYHIILIKNCFGQESHDKFTAFSLAALYLTTLAQEKDSITHGLDTERSVEDIIKYRIYEDYLLLKQYTDRVELVGKLS